MAKQAQQHAILFMPICLICSLLRFYILYARRPHLSTHNPYRFTRILRAASAICAFGAQRNLIRLAP